MSDTNDSVVKIEVQPETAEPVTGGGCGGFLRKWNREDLVKRWSLNFRGIALICSLLSGIVMASNKHGDLGDFDKVQEYRYLLAVAILSSFYTGCQTFRGYQELCTGKKLLQPRTAVMFDFIGDQIVAYLLISSGSAAIPITERMREFGDNIFIDSSSSAISTSFLAFVCLSLSAYKLSAQTYI